MPGRGKRVNSTAKSIIVNVYEYFESQSKKTKASTAPKLVKKTSDSVYVLSIVKLVDHVQAKVEDKFWEQDGLHEQYLDEFIIRVTESDSSEDESSEESVDTSASSDE